jgi:ribosomal protein S27E
MTGSDESMLDGNAAAGPLAELFSVDLTLATVTCGGCGHHGPLAVHHLYLTAPALVLRCPACTAVVLRYSSSGGRLRLDMAGTRLLTIAADPANPADSIAGRA